MAEIVPFRGILYDTTRVDASRVLAPPYDVIDAAGRAELAAADPHNCVRLILPEGDGDERYTAARDTLAAWLKDGVLGRDLRPAIYRYHQVFISAELGGQTVTRRGFIAAVRLHRFDERVILPHERTLKGPKIDRLKLWSATQTHLSQVFTMYSDPSRETDRAFAVAEAGAPIVDGTTADGTRHLVWRESDRETIGTVQRLLAPMKLYIADGHHRYETMLALRDQLRERAGAATGGVGGLPHQRRASRPALPGAATGGVDDKSAVNYGALFLANMDDSGLIVLPTHRLVHGLDGFSRDHLLAKVSPWFDTRAISGAGKDVAAARRALADAGKSGPSLGAVFPGRDDLTLLSLKPSFDPAKAGLAGAPAVVRLDVTLLHQIVLERVLGIDRDAQEAQTNLKYIKDTGQALARIAAGEGQACFLMNATPVEQVRRVADAGEVMPQKSTYFYPKIASGIVFNPIRPDEVLE